MELGYSKFFARLFRPETSQHHNNILPHSLARIASSQHLKFFTVGESGKSREEYKRSYRRNVSKELRMPASQKRSASVIRASYSGRGRHSNPTATGEVSLRDSSVRVGDKGCERIGRTNMWQLSGRRRRRRRSSTRIYYAVYTVKPRQNGARSFSSFSQTSTYLPKSAEVYGYK